MKRLNPKNQGFILLPVVMAIALVASVAFLMNRDGANNVNRLAGEIATSQAEYVAKAGINQMYWQANNANCTGYANATNVSFGGQTYTGSISPTSNSPVSISVTANQPQGASYSVRRDMLKVYQPPVTKTLQLGTQLGKDATIASAYTSNNYGADDGEVLVTWLFSWYYRHQLIQFDLASLPLNAHILSAQLQLYRQSSGSGKTTINVHRLTRDWTEGTQSGSGTADGVTWKTYDGSKNWTTAGGDFDASLVAKALVDGGTTGFQSWDLTYLVQNWLLSSYPNYGVLLRVPTNTIFSAPFASKEDATIANRPKLVVTYNCECGQECIGNDCIPGNYSDEFSAINYTGNQGSFTWGGNWLESGESDGASTGKISVVSASQCVTGSCLKIRKDTSTVIGIARELNISNAKSAILTYSFRRTVVNSPGGGAVTLQVSKDAGVTFAALKSYPLDKTDTLIQAESIDISAYAATKTQIRFVTSGASYQSNMFIDNVDVEVSCDPIPTNSKSVTLNPVADTYLNSLLLTVNNGAIDPLLVGKNLASATSKGLLKFDVSSIPVTATVTSARLRLFGTAATGNGSIKIGIYKIIANWLETTATWSNFSAASKYNSTQLATPSAPLVPLAPNIVAEWTLPVALINGWLANAASNYGIALVYENSIINIQASFASKENVNSTLRPQLVINYTHP